MGITLALTMEDVDKKNYNLLLVFEVILLFIINTA